MYLIKSQIVFYNRATRCYLKMSDNQKQLSNPVGLFTLYLRVSFIVFILLFINIKSQVIGATIKSIKWKTSPESLYFLITPDKRIPYTTENRLVEEGYFSVELSGITTRYENKTVPINDFRLSQVKIQPLSNRLKFIFYPQSVVSFSVGYDNQEKNCLVVSITPTLKKLENCRVIIIDPGHGGKSRGARSAYKINGRYVWEKDIVLQIAYKLKRLIDHSPGFVAYLTRTDDRYISLSRRVELAQKMKGDLFISIHCNAVSGFRPSRVRGIEFFCWNEKGSESEAVKFLERLENDEMGNSIINPTNNHHLKRILTNLLKEELELQKQKSKQFCYLLNKTFRENSYFRKYNRGVKEARFKVLANYSMPAVLIEVGFLSNKYEARLLVNPDFQWIVSRAIFKGIKKYFSTQPVMTAGR